MNKSNRIIRIFNTRYKLRFIDYIEPDKEGNFTFGICESSRFTIR